MSKTLKEFLMTLGATTISIVLTFGTTAIIDRKKQKNEKREMVMMIMYDMMESIKEMEQVDDDLKAFFEAHVDIVAHPDKYEKGYLSLAVHYPTLTYTSTTETIFKSNIETIQTIGNILFVETVSSFYNERESFKSMVVEKFQQETAEVMNSYDQLRTFNSDAYPFYSGSMLHAMKMDFEQCKMMMKVTDEQLEVFSLHQQKLKEATEETYADEMNQLSEEWNKRRAKLQQARALDLSPAVVK